MSEERRDTLAGQTMNYSRGRSSFPTTRWSMVAAAGDPARKEYRDALVSLSEKYWYPLYAYVRRRGYSADEAQDLTQEFFVRILEGRYLDRAEPEKGRFRTYLLNSLLFFLGDESDRNRAQKRGGAAALPFEICSGEERYQREPGHHETPERIFERRWAHSLFDRVMVRLRDECEQHGRLELFNRLKTFLLGQAEASYATLAPELGMSEGGLKVAIHRLRKRYRDLFRLEIEETVADPSEVESELRYLVSALSTRDHES
jgi:RNA polymerase sigma factor (sigma-70 family)